MINRQQKNLEGQAHGEVDSSTALDKTMGLFSPPKEDETHEVVKIVMKNVLPDLSRCTS
jgi:hypothetical protein